MSLPYKLYLLLEGANMERNYTIYILLTHSGSLPSKLIRMYTREPYSHVHCSGSNLNELYSFGRLKPSNPIFGGFVRRRHCIWNLWQVSRNSVCSICFNYKPTAVCESKSPDQ